VLGAPLEDQSGRATTLAAYAGRIVVLVPFLSSCQEVCPLTTAALLQAERSVEAAGIGRQVAVVEVSIDPERDVPSRLEDYARRTGARWTMLTGSPATLSAFWHALGIYAERVPEGDPPGIDWETGRPYTYDVDHTDGFFLLDRRLHERFLTLSQPDLRGATVPPALSAMLDAQGRRNLAHPGASAWTVSQLLQGVGWLAGRAVSPVG
jgi:protein SCO1/2